MLRKFISVGLFSFIFSNMPFFDCIARTRTKKSKTERLRKRRKNRLYQKTETNEVLSSEEENIKNIKDKMSLSQFKEIWESWKKLQLGDQKLTIEDKVLSKFSNDYEEAKLRVNHANEEIDMQRKKIEDINKHIEILRTKRPRKRRDKKRMAAKLIEMTAEIKKLEADLQNGIETYNKVKEDLNDKERKLKIAENNVKIVHEAERALKQKLDMTRISEDKRNKIKSLKNAMDSIISNYKNADQLDKSQYLELNRLTMELKSLTNELLPKKSLNFNKSIAILNNLTSELQKTYNTQGFLNKERLYNAIITLRDNLEVVASTDNPKSIVDDLNKGLTFKVQLASYKNRNLQKHGSTKSNDLLQQEKEGELNHYTLRTFRNYWDANEFKKEMREIMGFDKNDTGADKKGGAPFIVAYRDGKRIPLNSVLDLIQKQKKTK